MLKNFGIKSKNVAIVYLSMLASGMLFFLPIRTLYLEANLFSITNVSIIFAVEAIGIAIFEMPTGAIADLFGRKKTLVLSNLIHLLSLLILYIGGSMPMFIFYAIIHSFARSLSSGTEEALIYDTLKKQK